MTEKINRREFVKRGVIGLGGILAGLNASGRERTALAQGPEDLPADILAEIDKVTPDVIKNDPNVNLPNKETMGYWRTREDGRMEIWRTGMTYQNLKPELGWVVATDVLISKDGKTKVVIELDPEAERYQKGNWYQDMKFNEYAKKKLIDWIAVNTKNLVGKTVRVQWVRNFAASMSSPEFVEKWYFWPGETVAHAYGKKIVGKEVHVRAYTPGYIFGSRDTPEELEIENDNQVISEGFLNALMFGNGDSWPNLTKPSVELTKYRNKLRSILPIRNTKDNSRETGKVSVLFDLSGRVSTK